MFARPSNVLIVIWVACTGLGVVKLLHYELTPAPTARTAGQWPAESRLARDSSRPTLVLFLHPLCPCSRATLAELHRLDATCGGKFALRIVFVRPPHAAEGWEQSDLYRAAQQAPQAVTVCDIDGVEAARFGAVASGQAFLYAADGELLFQGGITASRGHEGDNAGRTAVASLIQSGQARCDQTPVFGCPLVNKENTP